MSSDAVSDDIFEFEDEYDELDLVKLISTNANDLNQYLVFKGSNEEWYALNVSKVEEVMVYDKNINIAHNNDSKSIIYGTADIRNTMTTLVYFDDWFENQHLDDSEYELIILANYGGYKLGIIVKEVANISTIEAEDMSDNSQSNAKTTFIAKIPIEAKEQICTIYDGDKMLFDIFDSNKEQNEEVFDNEIKTLLSDKVVYFADDSKLVRNLVEELFIKLEMQYKIFTDGSLLVKYIQSHPDETVDLFITDLEMPNMGGREVIKKIREENIYDSTPILVHTNMSNDIMDDELMRIGANGIIGKMNMLNLSEAIIKGLGK
ncbi:MAG: chemotaxis protein CheV [Sulfurimonas sp.]|nr:chemotaxis protein CheV [Sulfurimonas sp.]